MLTEDYCSQEVFQLLREKGFPVGIGSWSKGFVWDGEGYVSGLVKYENSITHQTAMKWLREIHNIFIVIEPHMYDYINEKNSSYITSLWQGDTYYENVTSKDYPTFEEAVDATLKYVLENLI